MKLKINKTAKKRFKVSSNGLLLRKSGSASHLRRKEDGSRRNRKKSQVSVAQGSKFKIKIKRVIS